MVNRVMKYGLVTVACILPALLGASPASAISWSEKGPDGKVCRVLLIAHTHFGFSGVKSSREAAAAVAVRRWSSFTAWEYGKAWGHFSLARNRQITCNKSVLGGWRCRASAQPCKN